MHLGEQGKIFIPRQYGFSLIELVIVVVIIATLTAIAVAAMSRTATSSKDVQLVQNLNVVRGALDRYQAEHGGNYPTTLPNGLIYFTDVSGNFTGAPVAGQTFGPYLSSMPICPVGPNVNNSVYIDITLTRVDGKVIVPQDISKEPILAAVRSANCLCVTCACEYCYCRSQVSCVCSACPSKVTRPSSNGGFGTPGWRYNPNNGAIRANAGTATDGKGKLYLQY